MKVKELIKELKEENPDAEEFFRFSLGKDENLFPSFLSNFL